MINNIKLMLLGIFLAVMSVGAFILADEVEIFLIIAIVLPILAVYTFVNGFIDNDKADSDKEDTKEIYNENLLIESQSTIIEQ